jgi:hypothetical protein
MKKKKKNKTRKKYVAIGKHWDREKKQAIYIKHWFNSIDKWMVKIAPKFNFMWINFFYHTGENKGMQFQSWTSSKGFFNPNK